MEMSAVTKLTKCNHCKTWEGPDFFFFSSHSDGLFIVVSCVPLPILELKKTMVVTKTSFLRGVAEIGWFGSSAKLTAQQLIIFKELFSL